SAPNPRRIINPEVSENIGLEEENKSGSVEFSLNDKYRNQQKQEQNIVLTPSRFDRAEPEEENEAPIPLGTNVLLTPTPIVAAATELASSGPSMEITPATKVEEKLAEPTFTIEKTEE